MEWTSVDKTSYAIHWILVNLVDIVIHLLNNSGQVNGCPIQFIL